MAGLRLEAQIGADATGFNRVVGGLGTTVGRSLSGIKSQLAAAFSIGAISALVKGTIDLAGRLRDVADNLNINVELLQRLTNAARLAGGSLEDIERFGASIGQARGAAVANPSGKEAAAFGRLGFSQSEIANVSVGAFLERMAARVAQGLDGQGRNDFIEVGGKAAKKLIAGFSTALDKNGSIMTTDMIDQLDSIGDKFTQLSNLLKVEMAPGILKTTGLLIAFVNQLKQFGSQAGAASARPVTTKEIGQFVLFPLWPILKRLLSKEAISAVLSEVGDQDENAASAAAWLKGRQSNRLAFENASPGYAGPSFGVKGNIYSDPLLAVGNFLGSGRNAIGGIQQRILDEAKKQTEFQRKIWDKMAQGFGIDIGVPKI